MIVMTGANGRLGRLVANAPARRGAATQVTLATRDPSKIADLAALDFKIARADFSDPESMRPAFAGAKTVLMISMPGPVEVRIPLHRNAFDAVKQAGVGRLVYTSRVNPAKDSLYPFAPIHVFSENYLKETGVPATIIRNNEYVENIAWLVKKAAKSGKLILPGAKGKVPYMAVADIAEIIAKLLIEEGHAGKTYELNGPEALHRSEIAALIASAAKRPVEVVPITRDEYGRFMEEHGRPPFVVEMLKGFYDAIDAGEFAKVWPDAPRLLGLPTQTIHEFIERTIRT